MDLGEALLWVGSVAVLLGALLCIPRRTRRLGVFVAVLGSVVLVGLIVLVAVIANEVGS